MRDEAARTPDEAAHPFPARGLAKNTSLAFDVVRPLLPAADRQVLSTPVVRRDVPRDAAETPATHPDALIRTELAGSTAARHVWARLAEDEDVQVRRAPASKAERYRRPLPLLLRLADDPNEDVRAAVMLHESLPTDVRERVEASVEPQHYHPDRRLTPQEAPPRQTA